jgi:Tfp pilus assembly PilM family ATPase
MGISLKDLNERIRSRIPGAAGTRPAVRGLPAATALEIDGLTLRIADASRSGTSSRVDQVRSCPLELPENADRADASVLGSAIAKALAKARIKPGPVVLGIGRSQVILRTVVVPDTGLTGTIAALVRFQVARDLPFRLDEAVIDFQILRKLPARPALDGEVTAAPTTTATATNDSVDRVEALVAITRQESLDFLRRVAEAAGVSLAAVGWLSQANATCLQLASGGAGSPSAPRALVALKSEEVGIEILEGRSLLFSRGMPMPSSLDTEPETWIRAATIEVVRTLHAFGGTAGRTAPEAALILGGTGREAALSTALETRLGFPVPQVTLARSPGLDSSEAAAVASGFTSIGLALGATDPAGLEFDFLNPKRPTPPPDLRKIRMIAGFTVGLVILMAVLGVRKTLISRREATLTALQAELTTGEKKRPVYRQMIQQAATLKAWSAEERDWLDHYAHLSAVLPPSEEIYLTSVAFGPNRAIKLGVQARNGEILGKVDRLLRAAGYDVKPLAVTPGADRNGYNFRTTVELTVPAKLKFDLTKLTPPARPADDASLETLRKGGAR